METKYAYTILVVHSMRKKNLGNRGGDERIRVQYRPYAENYVLKKWL
jgi:hypothetical protein